MIGWFSFGLCITFINKIDEKKRYFCHQNCFIFLLLFLSLIGPDDSCDMSRSYNVHRRKTDLMPTIPSPRDTCRSSLGTYTPRTPGSNWHDIKNFYLHFFSVQNCLKLLTHDAMFDLIRKVFYFTLGSANFLLPLELCFDMSHNIFFLRFLFDFATYFNSSIKLNFCGDVKDAPFQWPAWTSCLSRSVAMAST